jgi:hypothetical protein
LRPSLFTLAQPAGAGAARLQLQAAQLHLAQQQQQQRLAAAGGCDELAPDIRLRADNLSAPRREFRQWDVRSSLKKYEQAQAQYQLLKQQNVSVVAC